MLTYSCRFKIMLKFHSCYQYYVVFLINLWLNLICHAFIMLISNYVLLKSIFCKLLYVHFFTGVKINLKNSRHLIWFINFSVGYRYNGKSFHNTL